MLRLLGILAIGNLLFGGHRRRRALRRGLFLGGLLGYLASKHFDTERVREDARETVRAAKKTARDAARALRDARRADQLQEIHRRTGEHVREAHERTEERLRRIHEQAEARRAARTAPETAAPVTETARETQAVPAVQALPEIPEVHTAPVIDLNRDLVEDLERDARTAAMAMDVPTIDFPEEDEKYTASRKYGYA